MRRFLDAGTGAPAARAERLLERLLERGVAGGLGRASLWGVASEGVQAMVGVGVEVGV